MRITTTLSFLLVIVGALVWFMIGLFDFNLVAFIFGSGMSAVVSRIIYSLVGIAGIWLIFYWMIYHPFRAID